MTGKLPSGFVKNPRLHAYMFVSGDAASRRDISRLMAKAILCRNAKDGVQPCGECDCCKKMAAGTHPDCIVIPGNEKTSVDDIRDVVGEAYLSTNEADFKIFILEDADEYNTQSQNALLKVVEEPPKGVRFILTASSVGAILPTVRSRVYTISGDIRDVDSIFSEIRKAKQALSDERVRALSYFVEGYEKADINSLDEVRIEEYIDKAYGFLSGKDEYALMTLPKKREDFMLCLQVFMLCTKQIALVKATGKMTDGVLSGKALSECNSKTSMKRAHALYDLFEECYLMADSNANINAIFTYLLQKAR